ncbi:DmsC/YnfH family molybdoenzyme membrane anchor subunit [Rubritalea tangerina]|uniref:DmsC/YnfH family molybdoenzyme membrane anchor subunit n=1 Tax=Rubritalea tangerina TaxID=430798 RepID=A0ABW4Z8E9_9BACT
MAGLEKGHVDDRVAPPAALSEGDVGEVTLIDQLLEEQRTFSAVERFSQKHEYASTPIQEKYYKDLIPIRKPSTGEQYAFEVDMDKCTGCKACVVACHSLNGLKEKESWRDIGTIRGLVGGVAEQQTVTSACHHCLDPGCLSGCPVGAYEKLENTGVVKHLDDQCIGCQYCSLKCPYDVPKYDDALGIVRKCDMCHERLDEGEAPACVQSCPNGAISIQLVSVEEKRAEGMRGGSIVAGAFRSDYTLPTTAFRSKRDLGEKMVAADAMDLSPAHNHVPLVWMLMLTQVAVGLSVVDVLGRMFAPNYFSSLSLGLSVLAVVLGGAGLLASVLHLGSPLGAWRVFLGLKTSWLSREVVLFGAWMPALIGYAVFLWYPVIQSMYPQIFGFEMPAMVVSLTGAVAVVLGLVSVFCSVMVYVDTKREFWSFAKTLSRFVGTTVLGGFAGLVAVEVLLHGVSSSWSVIGFTVAVLVKMLIEALLITPARNAEWSFAKKSALIQLKSLSGLLKLRWACFVAASLVLTLGLFYAPISLLCLPIILMGEWFERSLFFQAVVTLKMPGELSPVHTH